MNDRLGSLTAAVYSLKEKFNCFGQNFAAFTLERVKGNKPGNKQNQLLDRDMRMLQENYNLLNKILI